MCLSVCKRGGGRRWRADVQRQTKQTLARAAQKKNQGHAVTTHLGCGRVSSSSGREARSTETHRVGDRVSLAIERANLVGGLPELGEPDARDVVERPDPELGERGRIVGCTGGAAATPLSTYLYPAPSLS